VPAGALSTKSGNSNVGREKAIFRLPEKNWSNRGDGYRPSRRVPPRARLKASCKMPEPSPLSACVEEWGGTNGGGKWAGGEGDMLVSGSHSYEFNGREDVGEKT